ncbi:MAG: D-alanine--D-alanine ligase [Labilithrix sp.]|nr:D-alanine--D-alanine ligase [Labilithrix sp.]
MKKRRVGVLMGGTSGEREISLKTGEGVARALEACGHDVARVVFGDAGAHPIDRAIRDAEIDVAFLALHGRGGEDGCIQGMLELMGIPYTGSSVLASALAMDKLKAKEMFRLHNIPTPPYYVATEQDLLPGDTDLLAELHGSFGFPVIVKPRNEGSSIGLTKANDLNELRGGIEAALEHDRWALVERYIKATEVHVGILDGRVLGCIEVAPKSGIYDYNAKYTAGATEYIIPPRIASTRTRGVMNLAERAVRAIGCTGAVRVDLLVTEGENEYVLEVNTLPGMTPTSLLPKIAAHAGIDYAALCEMILEGATLHANVQKKPESERRRSGVIFTPLAEPSPLVRKAI